MKYTKRFTGYCELLKQNVSMEINYVDASDNERRLYEKGTFNCKYSLLCERKGACPLYEQAPNELTSI